MSAKLQQNGEIKLVIKDNGKGLPEGFDIEQSESLGLKLIDSLSAQLRGEYILENTGNGTQFVLEFEMEEPQTKVPV